MSHAAEDIQKHIRVYISVFVALAVLTVVTVGISYLDLTVGAAIALALVVACVKASLVALYFMHLIDEQKGIYWLLSLTVMFFVFLMYMPSAWKVDDVKLPSLWSTLPMEGSAAHVVNAGKGHGGGHGGGHDDAGHGDGHGDAHGGGH